MRLTEGQRRSVGLTAYLRDRMARTGLTACGQKIWTPPEVALLTVHYPDMRTLTRLLPGRTSKAIAGAALRRGLGRAIRKWSPESVTTMRKLARSGAAKADFIAAFPDAAWRQIERAMHRRGIKRRRLPLKVYGDPVFDEIRRQARANGIFVYELAEMTRSGRYFRSRPNSRNWKHLGRGLDLFDLRLLARFPEPIPPTRLGPP